MSERERLERNRATVPPSTTLRSTNGKLIAEGGYVVLRCRRE
jgi:hypothetical protein